MKKLDGLRNKAISVKMSEKVFQEFVELSHRYDLLPSTMAYLIIKQYMENRTDSVHHEPALDLI